MKRSCFFSFQINSLLYFNTVLYKILPLCDYFCPILFLFQLKYNVYSTSLPLSSQSTNMQPEDRIIPHTFRSSSVDNSNNVNTPAAGPTAAIEDTTRQRYPGYDQSLPSFLTTQPIVPMFPPNFTPSSTTRHWLSNEGMSSARSSTVSCMRHI